MHGRRRAAGPLPSAPTGDAGGDPISTTGSSSSTPGLSTRSGRPLKRAESEQRRVQAGRRRSPSATRGLVSVLDARHAKLSPRRRPVGRPPRVHAGRPFAARRAASKPTHDPHASMRHAERSAHRSREGFWSPTSSRTPGSHFALTPDGRSVITASDEGELAWWDSRRPKTRSPRSQGTITRSRSAPKVTRGRRHQRWHPARRRAHRQDEERSGFSDRSPNGPRSARMGDGGTASEDGTVSCGTRGRGPPPRDAAGALRTQCRIRVRPRRQDAVHGGRRRNGDRVGPHGQRRQAEIQVHPRYGFRCARMTSIQAGSARTAG